MSFASKRPRLQGNEEGFSLVELAIVLVIIGLIIGGVLKGQDLIHSARVNAVQTTVDKVATAVNTFQGKYLGLPGDIANPQVVDASFPATGGNGNGAIDGGTPTLASTTTLTDENALFWAELGYANMLDGVSGSAIYDGTNLAYTASDALSASLGGFFTVLGVPGSTTGAAPTSSLWLQLGVAGATGNNNGATLTVVDASAIDKKFDDGNASGGTIRAIDGNGVTAGKCVDATSKTYTTTTANLSGTNCALQFQIN